MFILRTVFRWIAQILVVACFLSLSPNSFLPQYFASKSQYRPFLEEMVKAGQAKANFVTLLQDPKDKNWYRRDTKAIARLLADRAPLEYWNDENISEMAQYILYQCQRNHIPASLVIALMEVESGFQVNALSNKGALGLMQLMPETAQGVAERYGLDWNGPQTLLDPKRNVEFSVRYLAELRDRFQNTEAVLAAYNMGPSAIEKRLKSGEPLPLEFAQKVMKGMRSYQRQMRIPVTASNKGAFKWL